MSELHTVMTEEELKKFWWNSQTPEAREAMRKLDRDWLQMAFDWRGYIDSLIVVRFRCT